MKRFILSLLWQRDLIRVLVQKEIKVRYKNSLFGWLWSVGHPLMFGAIYWLIFGQVMRVPIADYPLFLLCGLFPWQWITSCLSTAPALFFVNSAIIKKTTFPRIVLPITQVLTEGVHFLFTLPVLALFLLVSRTGSEPTFAWLWGGALLFLVQFMLLTGLSCLLSSLTLFLRDLERFVQLGLMLLFYATPVLYSPEMVPARWQWLLNLNPLAPLILAWRELFMHGRLSGEHLLSMFVFSVVMLLVGYQVLRRLAPRFAEVL
ncbi:ABC transporter permease [Citrobacter braakii]|jgi:lipopolysaccharide transport system permease protein|uniref:ABC transporter permease n=1 Tax=Citrobacter TaxID=544 RepID=UPI000B9AF065|nr:MULTISPECIES: ABC transporter permease [Citrobacter]MBM3063305.1 ABC transporter permease [Citrobacter braakii]MBM3067884.1 ABC transporter permease [Citrobacter braakii]MCY9801616.1 ABC transporter permease [Citrobacter braakii]MDL4386210.1 ABC transporter permease [Citrobacter braakii]MDV0579172.1 ABC transporter permease [Citrobacter braakii]